jgi:hypothetical protein
LTRSYIGYLTIICCIITSCQSIDLWHRLLWTCDSSMENSRIWCLFCTITFTVAATEHLEYCGYCIVSSHSSRSCIPSSWLVSGDIVHSITLMLNPPATMLKLLLSQLLKKKKRTVTVTIDVSVPIRWCSYFDTIISIN